MLVLIILFTAYALSSAISKAISGDWQLITNGNVAMFFMLCFTAFGHFKFGNGMKKMLPEFFPMKKEIIFLTGILEIFAGVGLLFAELRYITGMLLILFFILILPANIKAAIDHLDYQKGTLDGKGTNYLWFRIPMQMLLIFWVWYFSVRG